MKTTGMMCSIFLAVSSIIVLYSNSLWYIIPALAAVYLYVAHSKKCRGQESMWIFVLVLFSLFPVNVAFGVWAFKMSGYLLNGMIGRVSATILLVAVMFSVEEIITGIIGRMIWKNQENDE